MGDPLGTSSVILNKEFVLKPFSLLEENSLHLVYNQLTVTLIIVIIAINQKIINYFLYLHNKGNDPIVKQIFLMSADLHSSGKSSFYSG